MKTASFKYTGAPTGKSRPEIVYGKVTQKDDGKVSISLNTGVGYGMSCTYAAKYAAKQLAKAIVAADFKHEAVYDFKDSGDASGLVSELKIATADFKADFIIRTKAAAKRIFAHNTKLNSRTTEEWYKQYEIPFHYTDRYMSGKPTLEAVTTKETYNSVRKKEVEMSSVRYRAKDIVAKGFPKFEAEEVMEAERHYNYSIEKLAYRLTQKGITDGSKFDIVVSGLTGGNIELKITHGDVVTRAWTIIAEGPIQRAHYRYLVK